MQLLSNFVSMALPTTRAKPIKLQEMERQVAHNARRQFPPITRSEFRVRGHVVCVICKFTPPSTNAFTYVLDGELVDAVAVRRAIGD